MNNPDGSIQVAVGLMRMALSLLERAEESDGPPKLQQAIDAVLGGRSPEFGEGLSPEQACLIAGVPLNAR